MAANGDEFSLGPSYLPEQIERQTDALTIPWRTKKLTFSPNLLYRMAETGKLPSFRIGSLIRVSPAATAVWLRTMQCWPILKTSSHTKGQPGAVISLSFEKLVPRTTASLLHKSERKQKRVNRKNRSVGGGHSE